MQERQVYTVRAIKVGQSWVPRPEVFWMEGFGEWELLYFIVYLIQGGGKNVLVNTGPPQDLTELNTAWLNFFKDPRAQMVREEHERIQNALQALGLSPDDIHYVIITPIQAYATANIPMFRNATICISRKGWIEDFQAPYYHLHVPRHLRLPPEVNHYLQNEGWEKLRLLEDEDEVLPGITTSWVGVHHRSSIAVKVRTPRGTALISDSFFKYPNVEQHKYLGIMECMMECDRAYRRFRREADILLPLYDPEVFERFPNGVIA